MNADYNEKLSSEAREKNQLLQTQLDNIHDELTKYKVQCLSISISYRLVATSRMFRTISSLNSYTA